MPVVPGTADGSELPRDDATRAALRVTQSVGVVRQMPMVLFGNGLGCVIGSLAISADYSALQRLPLVVGMWLLLVPVAINWLKLRRRAVPAAVSTSRITKLTIYSGVLGHVWAAYMLWYLPGTSHDVASFLVMGCAFLAAGSAAILYVIPLACVLYAFPMLASALLLTATSGSPSALPLTLLVALMSCGVGWMLYANWRNFRALFIVSHEKSLLLQAAARATAAKSEFLENMSHEIRNPLTSVIGYANLLRESELRLPPDLRGYVRNVVNGGEALKVLLNDILDLAKLDANHITLTPVPFQPRELITDVESLVSLSAAAKKLHLGATLSENMPDWLIADPFRLRQVMLNLLGNAIKFTERGRVDIAAAWMPADDDDGWLVIEITDTGPGIPAATRERLFRRFAKHDTGTAGYPEGTGLGLAICQRLMELMGGSIALRDQNGYGSTFEIRVPATRSELPQPERIKPAATATPTVAARHKKILVADDLQPNRELLRLMLEPHGHTVLEAGNGMQVVTLCIAEAFDLILMDIDMPGVDGLMATRLLRRQCPLNAHTPVIAITGHVARSHLEEFRAAGMDDHLAKPLSASALRMKVDAWTAGTDESALPGKPG